MDDEAEEYLEHLIFQAEALPGPTNATLGRVVHDAEATIPYRAHLVGIAGELLVGLRIGLDPANGSASLVRSRPPPRARRGGRGHPCGP